MRFGDSHSSTDRPELLIQAMRHGVLPQVEVKMAHRGWLLWKEASIMTKTIYKINEKRQEELVRAEIGVRSCMAQVPIEFESDS